MQSPWLLLTLVGALCGVLACSSTSQSAPPVAQPPASDGTEHAPAAPLPVPPPVTVTEPAPSAQQPAPSAQPAPVAQPTPSAETSPTVITPAAKDAAAHLNAFAFDLFARTRNTKANQLASPASIAIALHMLTEGARGGSQKELTKVLHLANGDSAALAELVPSWLADAKAQGHDMAIANRVYVRQGLALVPPFSDTMRDRYRAPLEVLDFAKDPGGSTKLINDWVKTETHGRIDPLLTKELDDMTAVVLANAIYLKAQWARKFDPKATEPAPFMAAGTREVSVPFMHATGTYQLARLAGVSVLELPYAGGTLAMDIVLPDDPKGLEAFERQLDAQRWDQLIAALSSQRSLKVALPRFKIEGATVALKQPLQKLGMPGLFEFRRADLSGMAGKPGEVAVENVYHRAFVEVTEEGTEAAAATAVVTTLRMAVREMVFDARHPFLFAIRDLKSGAVLFVGHVVDPS